MADRLELVTDAFETVLQGFEVRSKMKSSPGAGARVGMGPALVAYFGPDLDDSVVRRRVAQWRHAGFSVLPLAFSRNSDRGDAREFINLGRVMRLSRWRRVIPLARAALRIHAERQALQAADLLIARNLDIALLALFARWAAASSAPVAYEVLDVNASCTAPGWRGALVRRLEKWVLARIDLLVVSSPYFATVYYEGLLKYRRSWFLFENKIPKCVGLSRLRQAPLNAPAAAQEDRNSTGARRWRIGWFGYLDDEKSWEILRSVAEKLHDHVSIYVRGTPYTNFNMRRFLADVERLDNVTYGGPYRNPDDLADVYGAADMIWSTDFNFPGANSKWLLTNSLYEAGYFKKPVLGLVGTAVGQFVATWGAGWCLGEPIGETLTDFIRNLTPEQYDAKLREVAELDPILFVETDEIERIWTLLRGKSRAQDAASPPRRQATTIP